MATAKTPPPEKPRTLKARSKELVERLAEVAKDNDPEKEKAHQAHEEQREKEKAAIYAAFLKNKKD